MKLRELIALALLAGIGGTVGSLARELITLACAHAECPVWIAHAVVNISGGLIAGLVVGWWVLPEASDPLGHVDRSLRAREHVVVTGFLGGFTTISGFALDCAHAMQAAHAAPTAPGAGLHSDALWTQLLPAVVATGCVAVAAAAIGAVIGRRLPR